MHVVAYIQHIQPLTAPHKVSPASERHLMTLQTGQYAPAKILRYDPWAECGADGRKWPGEFAFVFRGPVQSAL